MRRRHRSAAGALVALALLALAASAAARPPAGGLDPSFAGRGWTVTPPGSNGGEAEVEIGTSPDGSVIVGGVATGNFVRLQPDGSPDTAFGAGGELELGWGTAAEGSGKLNFFTRSMAVDSRGRLVVFGEQVDTSESFQANWIPTAYRSEAMVLRLKPDGTPDPSFGAGEGYVRDAFGFENALDVGVPMVGALTGVVDSRDRPVLVLGEEGLLSGCYAHGSSGLHPVAVARLTRAGLPDPSFGGGDGVAPTYGSGSFHPAVLGLDARDEPVAAVGRSGSYKGGCGIGTWVYRLGARGRRLASFGEDGFRSFTRLQYDLTEPSGSLILSREHGETLGIVKVLPDGDRDMSFGRQGLDEIHLGRHLYAWPAAVDRQGRILLAGYLDSPPETRRQGGLKRSAFALARLLPDGKIDRDFGRHGWVFTRLPRRLELSSVDATLDRRGRLLLAAAVGAPKDEASAFAVARYLVGS